MSVTYLGQMNLASAIPGIGQAVAGLQKTVGQLGVFKVAKTEEVERALVDVQAMSNVSNQAQGLLQAGQTLIAQADGILAEANGVVNDLLGSVTGAGVGLYAFNGNAATLGQELAASLQAQGASGQVTAVILVASDAGAVTAVRKIFNLT